MVVVLASAGNLAVFHMKHVDGPYLHFLPLGAMLDIQMRQLFCNRAASSVLETHSLFTSEHIRDFVPGILRGVRPAPLNELHHFVSSSAFQA